MIATILCLFIGAAITIGGLIAFAYWLAWFQENEKTRQCFRQSRTLTLR